MEEDDLCNTERDAPQSLSVKYCYFFHLLESKNNSSHSLSSSGWANNHINMIQINKRKYPKFIGDILIGVL